MDEQGDSVPESISGTEEDDDAAVRREEEANILVGIQKEVGFTFEVGKEEVQSKLVELEKIDYEKKIVRERGRSDQ
jgi:hypothetical protein